MDEHEAVRANFQALRTGDSCRETWLYFVGAEDWTGPVKIGVTDDVMFRLRQLQIGSPIVLTVYGYVWCDLQWERELHEQFADDRLHGEWFRRSDRLDAVIALATRQDFAGIVNFLLRDYEPTEDELEVHQFERHREF